MTSQELDRFTLASRKKALEETFEFLDSKQRNQKPQRTTPQLPLSKPQPEAELHEEKQSA